MRYRSCIFIHMTEEGRFIGLLKFFRDESHLDDLVAGKVRATPPEVYRGLKQEGVSDPNESLNWRHRHDPSGKVNPKLNGKPLPFVDITMRRSGDQDHRVHCWTILREPTSPAEVRSLGDDLERLRTEFGAHYVFIPADHHHAVVKRVADVAGGADFVEVSYHDDWMEWSPTCKSSRYSYQREGRYLFDPCDTEETQVEEHQVAGGFGAEMTKNGDLHYLSEGTELTILRLRPRGVDCHPENLAAAETKV